MSTVDLKQNEKKKIHRIKIWYTKFKFGLEIVILSTQMNEIP